MVHSTAQVDGRGPDEDSENDEDLFNFKSLFRHMHSEARRQYSGLSCDIAKSEKNIRLNRYSNVSPYDSTRVVLSEVNGNDYINANLAHSSAEPQLPYILTQGPKESTVDDFWRMAWENNVKNIVMLNKLYENGRKKCEQYWPERIGLYMTCRGGSNIFYKITLKEETYDENDRFVVRQFELEKTEDSDSTSRTVTQFHYIAWPDFGVPETTQDFGDFFHLLIQHNCFSSPSHPSIIHCSAGIGRTGTLILVDSCLKLLSKQKFSKVEQADLIDIAYREVLYLRQFRAGLIQTADQLEFSICSIEALYNEYLERIESNQEENLNSSSQVESAQNDTDSEYDLTAETSGEEEIELVASIQSASHDAEDDLKEQSPRDSPVSPNSVDKPEEMSRMEQKMQLAERIAKIKRNMQEMERQREQKEYWYPKIIIAGASIAAIGIAYYFYSKPPSTEIIDDKYISIQEEL